ncbi:MAG: response regulator [Candidatus Hodarchaeales archaeon]
MGENISIGSTDEPIGVKINDFTDTIAALHVDDEESFLKLTKKYLAKLSGGKLILDGLADPERVFTKLQEKAYDVIVCDYQMARIDGIQILKQLRAHDNSIPFIMLTGRGREEIAMEALNLGANRYIKKGDDVKSQYGQLFHAIKTIVHHDHTEKALREKEELYRIIVETTGECIWIIDVENRTTYVNERMARMLDLAVEEMMGKSLFDFMDEELIAVSKEAIEKRKQGNREQFDFKFRRKDGTEVWTLVKTNPIFDKEGHYAGALGLITDITDRKQAEETLWENEQLFRSLSESAIVGIVIIQEDELKYANETVTKINGYTWEEMERWTVSELLSTIHPDDRAFTAEQMQKKQIGVKEGVVPHYSFRLVTKNEEIRWIETYSRTIIYKGKNADFVTLIDITDRKKAEEELKKFKAISDFAGYGIGMISLDGHLIYTNEVFSRMHGYTREELVGKHFSILHDEEQMKTVEMLRKQLEQEGSYTAEEVWHKRKDGTIFPTLMNGTAVRDDAGKPLYLSATAIDITEQKRAEEALRESEEKFRTLAESTLVGVLIIQDDQVEYANEAAAKNFGFSREEVENMSGSDFFTYIHPEDRSFAAEQMRKKQVGEMEGMIPHYTIRVVAKTGEKRWIDVHSRTIVYGGKPADLVAVIDTTDRKEAEESLKDSEQEYRELVDKLHEGLAVRDTNGIVTFVNPRMAEMLGYTKEEMLGKHWSFYVPPTERDKIEERMSRRPEETSDSYETILLTKEGERVPVMVSVTQLQTFYETYHGSLTLFTDITELKQAEEALKKSEEKFAKAFHSSPNSIAITRMADGHIVDVNDSFIRTYGYSLEELVDRSVLDLNIWVNPKRRPEFIKALQEHEEVRNFDVQVRAKSGEIRTMLFSAEMIDIDGEACLITTASDITERKRAENALRERVT